MQAVATVTQKRSTPEAATMLGEGKVAEARLVCLNAGAQAAIFDGELTGSQLRNLSAALQVEVIDRTMLILEIFRSPVPPPTRASCRPSWPFCVTVCPGCRGWARR